MKIEREASFMIFLNKSKKRRDNKKKYIELKFTLLEGSQRDNIAVRKLKRLDPGQRGTNSMCVLVSVEEGGL